MSWMKLENQVQQGVKMKFDVNDRMMQFRKTSIFLLITFFLSFALPIFAIPTTVEGENKDQTYLVGISKKHKFVWFRVAKVGSSTIRSVFRKNHVKMPIYSEDFSFNPEKYKDYFKFAFVRNPWARIVSCYCQKVENKTSNWKHYYGECFDKGFDYFVDFVAKKDLTTADRHIRLQTSLIPVNEVDFIGRLENFEEDFKYVLKVLKLDNRKIPKKNSSNHAHYSRYYNERTKEIIAQKYKADIEAFGYQFEVK
jgi:hypothetical protein